VTEDHQLPRWSGLLGLLAPAEQLTASVDPTLEQETYALVLKSLAQFSMRGFVDPSFPDLVPAAGSVFNGACANADFVYTTTPIAGTGTYCLSGFRGSSHLVVVALSRPGRAPVEFELDDLEIAPDATFEVLLSADRPAGHSGNWQELDPATVGITIRQASYNWSGEVDGRFAIERTDGPLLPPPLDAAKRSDQLRGVFSSAAPYARMWIDHVAGLRSRGMVNQLELDDWADRGGVRGQMYVQGIFQLDPGEGIVLETSVPDVCRYWGFQLSDPLWNAIDWVNRQSSLNGYQARLDTDGCFRAVVGPDDPGVPNWLDTGGHLDGTILGRWYRSSTAPLPTLTRVPLDEVRAHLPSDTPAVSSADRRVMLSDRRRGAQLRRRW
jgi:hypothetical protein